MKVVIIDYGAGNLFSVQQAFKRLGIETILTNNEQEIRSATHVVFPGVGHAKSAMKQLKDHGLDEVIPKLTQPVLGICLGMQLMCGWNDEGDLDGLGIFRVRIESIQSQFTSSRIRGLSKWQTDKSSKEFGDGTLNYPVPHMGWNDVQLNGRSEAFYFVHSYAAAICKETWGIASYPAPFSAALKKDNFYGVQFHPEKSGTAGEQLLSQFLAL
ncbi:MAG: Imidazole glycerol phosphate synthase subunit hisH [Fluviicola sp.]|jgi:glutamine amidotransferase|uniref:imidazole glycerol phosphate synthase subunit HisH n=1 Tax=Fluviicola sp. TaxID=1917219 RepID=UPI002636710D|nr:imidazole glycerol phosphate synthase subunit HisH [Fluviicola sp.]MDF3026235.1 Imidazole glycerol phosphate synthase subunit hisH [Fluviicola sp.]